MQTFAGCINICPSVWMQLQLQLQWDWSLLALHVWILIFMFILHIQIGQAVSDFLLFFFPSSNFTECRRIREELRTQLSTICFGCQLTKFFTYQHSFNQSFRLKLNSFHFVQMWDAMCMCSVWEQERLHVGVHLSSISLSTCWKARKKVFPF